MPTRATTRAAVAGGAASETSTSRDGSVLPTSPVQHSEQLGSDPRDVARAEREHHITGAHRARHVRRQPGAIAHPYRRRPGPPRTAPDPALRPATTRPA